MVNYPTWDPAGALGWTVLLDDDFPGAALSANWQPGWFKASGVSGPVNSAETVRYDSANVTVAGSSCALALTNTAGALITTNPGNAAGATGFTAAPPMAVEARIFLPGSGSTVDNWPAFWLDTTGTWPQGVEVDIMEGLANQTAAHIQDASSVGGPGIYHNVGPGWHTFGCYWEAGSVNRVTYYYDGVSIGSIAVDNPSPGPHYLICDNTTSTTPVPGTMLVDWVRVWAPGVSGAGGGSGTGGTGGASSGGSPGGVSVVQTATLPAAQVGLNQPMVVPLAAPTTAGNTIVVCAAYGNPAAGITISGVQLGTGTTSADFTGTADNFAQAVSAVSAGFFQYAAIWADPGCAGGKTAVQVTPSAFTGTLEVVVYEVFGSPSAAVVDGTASAVGASTAFASGAVANSSGTPEIAVGVASIFNQFTGGGSLPGSPWTSVEPQGDTCNMCAGTAVLAAGGSASFAGTQVSGAGNQWAACAITLKSSIVVPAGTTPGTRPSRSLLVSLAPQAGMDAYGNSYPAGLQVGAASAPQVAIVPNQSAGGAAEVKFPLPVALSNVPNLAAGLVGAFAELLLSGPAVPAGGVGDDDWVQVFLISDGSGAVSARGELRYVASGGAVTTVASWDVNGLKLPTRAAPATPSGGCVIWYDGSKLWVKGTSGTAVALATT